MSTTTATLTTASPEISPASSTASLPSSIIMAGPSTSTLPTLRGMYQRAARAFLQRNTSETQNLIENAFRLLTPPNSSQPDALSSQRKKWDILRITLETTLYTSPTTSSGSSRSASNRTPTTPSSVDALRSNLLLSPPSLLATLHTRSLRLFTPPSQKPSPAFLPAQILVSLVLASLKLECPQVGRGMIEEWLARRATPELALLSSSAMSDDGYAKVIDVYCLHILPRLGEWEYAVEFLRYEGELPSERRSQISDALKRLHLQSQVPASPPPPYHSKGLPASSRSSSADDLQGSRELSRASSPSSASIRTIVPATPRPTSVMRKSQTRYATEKATDNGTPKSSFDEAEVRPISRASTARPEKSVQDGTPPSTNLYHALNTSGSSSHPIAADPPAEDPPSASPLVARFHAQLAIFKIHYLPSLRAKLPFLVCVLLPMIVVVAQLRRAAVKSGKGRRRSADSLRRRLGTGAVKSVWSQAWQAVQDTVVMAGRGLV